MLRSISSKATRGLQFEIRISIIKNIFTIRKIIIISVRNVIYNKIETETPVKKAKKKYKYQNNKITTVSNVPLKSAQLCKWTRTKKKSFPTNKYVCVYMHL